MKSVKEQLEDIWNESKIQCPSHVCCWSLVKDTVVINVNPFISITSGYYTPLQTKVKYDRVVFKGRGKRMNPKKARGVRYDK